MIFQLVESKKEKGAFFIVYDINEKFLSKKDRRNNPKNELNFSYYKPTQQKDFDKLTELLKTLVVVDEVSVRLENEEKISEHEKYWKDFIRFLFVNQAFGSEEIRVEIEIKKEAKCETDNRRIFFSPHYVARWNLEFNNILVSFSKVAGILIKFFLDKKTIYYKSSQQALEYLDRLWEDFALKKYINHANFIKYPIYSTQLYREFFIEFTPTPYFVIYNEDTVLLYQEVDRRAKTPDGKIIVPQIDVRWSIDFYPVSIFQIAKGGKGLFAEKVFTRAYLESVSRKIYQRNKIIFDAEKDWLPDLNIVDAELVFNKKNKNLDLICSDIRANNKKVQIYLHEEVFETHFLLWRMSFQALVEFECDIHGVFLKQKIAPNVSKKREGRLTKKSSSMYLLPKGEADDSISENNNTKEDKEIPVVQNKKTMTGRSKSGFFARDDKGQSVFIQKGNKANIVNIGLAVIKNERVKRANNRFLLINFDGILSDKVGCDRVFISFDLKAGLLVACYKNDVLLNYLGGMQAAALLALVLQWKMHPEFFAIKTVIVKSNGNVLNENIKLSSANAGEVLPVEPVALEVKVDSTKKLIKDASDQSLDGSLSVVSDGSIERKREGSNSSVESEGFGNVKELIKQRNRHSSVFSMDESPQVLGEPSIEIGKK